MVIFSEVAKKQCVKLVPPQSTAKNSYCARLRGHVNNSGVVAFSGGRKKNDKRRFDVKYNERQCVVANIDYWHCDECSGLRQQLAGDCLIYSELRSISTTQ